MPPLPEEIQVLWATSSEEEAGRDERKREGKEERKESQGPLNGGVSNGGVSRSGLVLPFLSFLGLSRFPGFSLFVRGLFGDFPDLRFSSFSAY